MKTLVLEEIETAQKVFTTSFEEAPKYQMTKAEEVSVLKGLNDKKKGNVYSQEKVEQEMEVLTSPQM